MVNPKHSTQRREGFGIQISFGEGGAQGEVGFRVLVYCLSEARQRKEPAARLSPAPAFRRLFRLDPKVGGLRFMEIQNRT